MYSLQPGLAAATYAISGVVCLAAPYILPPSAEDTFVWPNFLFTGVPLGVSGLLVAAVHAQYRLDETRDCATAVVGPSVSSSWHCRRPSGEPPWAGTTSCCDTTGPASSGAGCCLSQKVAALPTSSRKTRSLTPESAVRGGWCRDRGRASALLGGRGIVGGIGGVFEEELGEPSGCVSLAKLRRRAQWPTRRRLASLPGRSRWHGPPSPVSPLRSPEVMAKTTTTNTPKGRYLRLRLRTEGADGGPRPSGQQDREDHAQVEGVAR